MKQRIRWWLIRKLRAVPHEVVIERLIALVEIYYVQPLRCEVDKYRNISGPVSDMVHEFDKILGTKNT